MSIERDRSSANPKPMGWLRRRWWVLALCAFGLFALYWITGGGEIPRYHWYSVRADFEVDGKIVSVGGTVECERKAPNIPPFNWGTGPGTPYWSSTEAFASRLESGGILVIRMISACGSSRSPIGEYYPDGYFPSVIWFDDPVDPTRAEILLSDAYFDQLNARYRFKKFEASRLGSGAFSRSLFIGNWRLRALYEELPLLKGTKPEEFRGYYITVADEEDWRVDPELAEALKSYREMNVIPGQSEILADRQLQRVLEGLFETRAFSSRFRTPPHRCRLPNSEISEPCRPLYRSYGMMPDSDSWGASYSLEERNVGFVALEAVEDRYPDRSEYRTEILGVTLSVGFGGDVIFAPESRQLMRFRGVRLERARPDGNEARGFSVFAY